jgi:hypothetical protein
VARPPDGAGTGRIGGNDERVATVGLVDRIGWSVLSSGLFLVLAAVVSERSGTRANIGGHLVNTHVTATYVLACLGAVLVVNGFVLLSYSGPEEPAGTDREP